MMKGITVSPAERILLANTALDIKYEGKDAPVTPEKILVPRRYEDKQTDLWTTYNTVQENLIKGGLRGRTAKGKIRPHGL
ncbi:UPF0380 protein yubP [Phytobacter diazotrophicus]